VHRTNTGARSRNHYCRGKAIDITYSECVCVFLGILPLIIRYAKRMRHIILSSVTVWLYRGADKSLARPTSRCIFLMVRIFRLLYILIVLIFL